MTDPIEYSRRKCSGFLINISDRCCCHVIQEVIPAEGPGLPYSRPSPSAPSELLFIEGEFMKLTSELPEVRANY